jgi:hypothetical protein
MTPARVVRRPQPHTYDCASRNPAFAVVYRGSHSLELDTCCIPYYHLCSFLLNCWLSAPSLRVYGIPAMTGKPMGGRGNDPASRAWKGGRPHADTLIPSVS